MLFYKCIDTEVMEQILKNHEHIRNLCHKYEQETKIISNSGMVYYIYFLYFFSFCFYTLKSFTSDL